MWYFAWILGVGLACAMAIINALWLEINDDPDHKRRVVAGKEDDIRYPGNNFQEES